MSIELLALIAIYAALIPHWFIYRAIKRDNADTIRAVTDGVKIVVDAWMNASGVDGEEAE